MNDVRFSPARLRELREAADLSRQQLAEAAGNISPRMIHLAESGGSVPGAEKLAAIARALGVDMESFFVAGEAA